MTGEWTEAPFPDVIDFQEGPGILAKDFRDEGVPLVRLAGLDRGNSVLAGCNYLDPKAVAKKWAHFALAKGDILLSTSASLGRIAVVGDEAVGAVSYTGIIRMRPRNDRLIARFIRYLLEGPDFQQQAEMVGAGSVIRHFGPMHLRQMTVRLPPPDEQRAIVNILGMLDDKIELNRRMNETLEALARALFKSWFADFDPVRAKAEGRDSGLSRPVADLFPGRLVDSELGEIPQGWRVGTIDEATSLIIDYRGKTPKKLGHDWSRSGIPAISAKNIKKGRLVQKEAMNFVNPELYDLWMKDRLMPGDILMTSEAPLGELLFLARHEEFCLSQRVFALRANPAKCLSTFLYLWLALDDTQERLRSRATGTTVLGIRQSELRKIEVLLPPLVIQKKAHDVLSECFSKIASNESESESLSALRNTLLPKLISGELRVPSDRSKCASAA